MFLNMKKHIISILSISVLFSINSDNDLLYNYYVLNGSPTTIEFDHLLKTNYESNLIYMFEINGSYLESYEEYESFLNKYYSQYKKENEKFINAIVEPNIFYISGLIGSSNIILGENNYTFGKTIGFHIDSPYGFKLFKKTIILGLKSSLISLPPSNSLDWDNFRSLNMSSTYSIKFGKQIYSLAGLGATLNSNNNGTNLSPLMSFDLAYEIPWKPLNIPFDITLHGSSSWDLKNTYIGFNIMLCKPYRLALDI